MNILHIANKSVPATGHEGGMPQSVTWLAEEQSVNHSVTVASPSGCSTDSFHGVLLPKNASDILKNFPAGIDVVHLHYLSKSLESALISEGIPFVTHVRGNVAGGCSYLNSIYVSKSHAARHSSGVFVYNGLPVNDYIFSDEKSDTFLFLGKVKRSNKGINDAVRFSKATGSKLVIAGGYRLGTIETWLPVNSNIKSVGVIYGGKKLDFLRKARALVFPIQWEEPFGLVLIEAMASGTPVLAYGRGAVPEIIEDGVTGFVCSDFDDLCAKSKRLDNIDPQACRDRVVTHFDIGRTAAECVSLYEKAIRGETW